MARVSVKMEIEKYEAHWAQANCPSDTEIRRYRHHASSSKLLEWPMSNLANARFKNSTMGKLAILKFKMARVSVKMEIEKYEAHWAQANCPSDTENYRYCHHASSSKLL
jgi:hypothetical protein